MLSLCPLPHKKSRKTTLSPGFPSASASSLPYEIIFLILGHLPCDVDIPDVPQGLPSPEILTLALISRCWYHPVMYWFYNAVFPKDVLACQRLLESLKSNKTLAMNITTLIIPTDQELSKAFIFKHSRLVENLVRRCPNLLHLKMPVYSRYFKSRILRPDLPRAPYLTKLKTMELCCFQVPEEHHLEGGAMCVFQVSQWLSQTKCLPLLESLTLSGISSSTSSEVTASKWPAMPKLEHFEIRILNHRFPTADPLGFATLFPNIQGSLTSLHICGQRNEYSVGRDSWLLTAYSVLTLAPATLESLALVYPTRWGTIDETLWFWPDGWDSVFVRFTSLRKLRLASCLILQNNDVGPIFTRLPANIAELTVHATRRLPVHFSLLLSTLPSRCKNVVLIPLQGTQLSLRWQMCDFDFPGLLDELFEGEHPNPMELLLCSHATARSRNVDVRVGFAHGTFYSTMCRQWKIILRYSFRMGCFWHIL